MLAFVEHVKKLPLICNELLKLVLVEVVGRVKAIEAALALASLDNVWTAHEHNWNELEWCVDRVDLVFCDLIFELREPPIVTQ